MTTALPTVPGGIVGAMALNLELERQERRRVVEGYRELLKRTGDDPLGEDDRMLLAAAQRELAIRATDTYADSQAVAEERRILSECENIRNALGQLKPASDVVAELNADAKSWREAEIAHLHKVRELEWQLKRRQDLETGLLSAQATAASVRTANPRLFADLDSFLLEHERLQNSPIRRSIGPSRINTNHAGGELLPGPIVRPF